MSPSPPVPIGPDGLLDGLRWGCIIRGALLDIVLTAIASVPLLLVLAGSAAFSEDRDAADRAIDQALASPEGLLWGALLGLGATVAGAWYGAARAGDSHVRHGGWVAIVSLALALPLYFVTAQSAIPNPLWYEVLTMAGMLPAGLLGGLMARELRGDAA